MTEDSVPVACSWLVTFAFATTRPCGSSTVPNSSAFPACAKQGWEEASSAARVEKACERMSFKNINVIIARQAGARGGEAARQGRKSSGHGCEVGDAAPSAGTIAGAASKSACATFSWDFAG